MFENVWFFMKNTRSGLRVLAASTVVAVTSWATQRIESLSMAR